MRLLLDTCALLWFTEGSADLSVPAREAIENPDNRVFVSVVSYWEIVIKQNNGKLRLPCSAPAWFKSAVELRAFDVLPMETGDVGYLHGLGSPGAHKDPFDRLIIATALHRQLTVATADSHFRGYGVPVVW